MTCGHLWPDSFCCLSCLCGQLGKSWPIHLPNHEGLQSNWSVNSVLRGAEGPTHSQKTSWGQMATFSEQKRKKQQATTKKKGGRAGYLAASKHKRAKRARWQDHRFSKFLDTLSNSPSAGWLLRCGATTTTTNTTLWCHYHNQLFRALCFIPQIVLKEPQVRSSAQMLENCPLLAFQNNALSWVTPNRWPGTLYNPGKGDQCMKGMSISIFMPSSMSIGFYIY